MKLKFLIVLGVAISLFAFIGCGGSSNNDNPSSDIKVTLNAQKALMCLEPVFGSMEVYLEATVTPNTASQNVTWNSSNPSVAVVSSNGVVTAKNIGKCVITATAKANGKATDKCEINVVDYVKPVSLEKGTYKFKYTKKNIDVLVSDSSDSEYNAIIEYQNYNTATSTDAGYIQSKVKDVNKNVGDIFFADLDKSGSKINIVKSGYTVAFNNDTISKGSFDTKGSLPWNAKELSVRYTDKKMFLINKEFIPIYKFEYLFVLDSGSTNLIRWWAPSIGWYVAEGKDSNYSELISYTK